MKHTNTLCGQNADFVTGADGGTCSYHWMVKGENESKIIAMQLQVLNTKYAMRMLGCTEYTSSLL